MTAELKVISSFKTYIVIEQNSLKSKIFYFNAKNIFHNPKNVHFPVTFQKLVKMML